MKIYIMIILICIAKTPVYAQGIDEAVPYISYEELQEFAGVSTFSELVSSIINGDAVSADNFLDKVIKILLGELKGGMGYVGAIVGFSMLSAFIKSSDINKDKGSGDLMFLITYCVISLFLLGILRDCTQTARKLSEDINSFVKMSVPAYIAFATAAMPVKAAGLEGVFLVMINLVSEFAGNIMINMFFYLGILYIVNYMSAEIHVIKLIELIRQTMFWILGFLLTIFSGITGLSGINAFSASRSGMNTIKYTVGHSIPIVGGFLADCSDLLFASARIFKNAFGIAGIAVIFIICLVPVIRLFAAGILLKVAAGLTEPFCDKRICECVSALGQTIIHIMVCVILLAVMFVFSFAVILLAGMGG